MRTTTLAIAATAALMVTACSSGTDTTADTGTAAEAPADDSDAAGDGDGDGGGEASGGGSVSFTGTDDVAWEQTDKSTSAGTVEVTLQCGESVPHGLAIEGVQGGDELAACDPGGSGSATVELEAGEYTFFCTVPGHRNQGMEGTLTVG